jgi:D-alanyl-D-alanine carboxypeptidase
MANPALFNPFLDAGEIVPEGEDRGRIVKASAFASPGEPVRLTRNTAGEIEEAWLGAAQVIGEEALKAEMLGRYDQRHARA